MAPDLVHANRLWAGKSGRGNERDTNRTTYRERKTQACQLPHTPLYALLHLHNVRTDGVTVPGAELVDVGALSSSSQVSCSLASSLNTPHASRFNPRADADANANADGCTCHLVAVGESKGWRWHGSCPKYAHLSTARPHHASRKLCSSVSIPSVLSWHRQDRAGRAGKAGRTLLDEPALVLHTLRSQTQWLLTSVQSNLASFFSRHDVYTLCSSSSIRSSTLQAIPHALRTRPSPWRSRTACGPRPLRFVHALVFCLSYRVVTSHAVRLHRLDSRIDERTHWPATRGSSLLGHLIYGLPEGCSFRSNVTRFRGPIQVLLQHLFFP